MPAYVAINASEDMFVDICENGEVLQTTYVPKGYYMIVLHRYTQYLLFRRME